MSFPNQSQSSESSLRYALITGASTGLGLELARLFAADGHPLILVARTSDRLTALANELQAQLNVDVVTLPMDLTETGAVARLLQRLEARNLGVRVLVNNAGIGVYGPFCDRDWSSIEGLIQLNITVLTDLTRGLLPAMQAVARTNAGPQLGVINVASTAAFQPGPLMAVYFASKAYVLSFSEALHEENRSLGVTVSAFCPGPTRTAFFGRDGMVPTGELTEADLAEFKRRDLRRMDAATAARMGYEGFLAGRAVVIPGHRNRMLTWVPRLLPRALVRRVVGRMLARPRAGD